MTDTDTDRISEAFRSAPVPGGLGVPASQVLLAARHARRRRTATRAAASLVSLAGVTAVGVWGGSLLAPEQEQVAPAREVVRESVIDPDVKVEDIYDMTHEERLASWAESAGLENPPTVEIIREVTPEEASELLTQCLAERGWVAEHGQYTMHTDQTEAFQLDTYRCMAAYPVDYGPAPTN